MSGSPLIVKLIEWSYAPSTNEWYGNGLSSLLFSYAPAAKAKPPYKGVSANNVTFYCSKNDFMAGQLENEMQKIGEGGMVAPLILFKGCSPFWIEGSGIAEVVISVNQCMSWGSPMSRRHGYLSLSWHECLANGLAGELLCWRTFFGRIVEIERAEQVTWPRSSQEFSLPVKCLAQGMAILLELGKLDIYDLDPLLYLLEKRGLCKAWIR